MNNNDLVAIDSTDLETITGGLAWDTTLPQAAVGESSALLGATAGQQPQPRGPLGRLNDLRTDAPPPPSPFKPQRPFQK